MNKTLKRLKEIQDDLNSLQTKIGSLTYDLELPIMIEKIEKYKKSNKGKKVTTAWLQREFQIGYAHAARLLDKINDSK